MNINKKIEEIRNKPEHVRMQYVWGAVLISMIFIFIIWLFSIKTLIQSKTPQGDSKFEELTSKIQEIKDKNPAKQSSENVPEGFGKQNTIESVPDTSIDSLDSVQQ